MTHNFEERGLWRTARLNTGGRSYTQIKMETSEKEPLDEKIVIVANDITPPETNPFHPLVWKVLLVVGVFTYGSYSVLMNLCEVDHKIPFSSASVVLMTEIIKLVASLTFSLPEFQKSNPFKHLTFRSCLPFSIPAILYCINNNLAIQMQVQMDPATFQILSNLKVLTTALLYRLIIQRPLNAVQWISLIILTVAGASHSYGGLKDKGALPEEIFITWEGLGMMMVYCSISALAGVYSEYILKKQQQISLSVQNMVLYVYGVICNGFLYWMFMDSQATNRGLFTGYNYLTWIIIGTQAVNGLIISAVMKHSSNIIRLFVISSAMIVTTLLSVMLLSLKLNVYVAVACLLVIFALFLYHKK